MHNSEAARIRVRLILSTYLLAVGCCLLLFMLHTVVLFDVAGLLVRRHGWLAGEIGPRSASRIMILGCFMLLFVVHIIEAACWGGFLRWRRLVGSFTEGLYFAAVSMTALGYGDIVLPAPWRHLGPLAAITGVLMFGCSAAFLFVLMQTIWTQHTW